jgi:hypothetical protein
MCTEKIMIPETTQNVCVKFQSQEKNVISPQYGLHNNLNFPVILVKVKPSLLSYVKFEFLASF